VLGRPALIAGYDPLVHKLGSLSATGKSGLLEIPMMRQEAGKKI
jgi:hypothetical protein